MPKLHGKLTLKINTLVFNCGDLKGSEKKSGVVIYYTLKYKIILFQKYWLRSTT